MAIASKLAIAIFFYIHPPTSTTSPQSRGLTKFQNKVNAALRISQIEPYAGEFERAATEIALRFPQRDFGQDAFRLWHGGSGGRSDSRTPLFPDGLAAFLCLGFLRLVVFYSGGTPE